MSLTVHVVHYKLAFDVELDVHEPLEVFKVQLFSLTNVPIERQKICCGGKVLKDDVDLASLNIKPGQKFTLVGSAELDDRCMPISSPITSPQASPMSSPVKRCPTPASELDEPCAMPQLPDIVFMEDVQEIRTTCSRVFFGDRAIAQPAFALPTGVMLCEACVMTCHQDDAQAGHIRPPTSGAGPFCCRCSNVPGRDCLFSVRLTPDGIQIPERLSQLMLEDRAHAAAQQSLQLMTMQEEQLRHRGEGAKSVFLSKMTTDAERVLQYEDPELQALALSLAPVDDIERKAREAVEQRQSQSLRPLATEADQGRDGGQGQEQDQGQGQDVAGSAGSDAGLAYMDERVCQLMHWFKHQFMVWTKAPPCQACSGTTKCIGSGYPTVEEKQGLAGHVEIYKCQRCSHVTRFPRYNHVRNILTTRQGRCGEWAQAFTLFCRAFGYETRFVLDWTDHVWTEVWSESLQRWVHMDPCEDVWDRPYLYEAGWGKKLSYIVAFSVCEVVDVTKRYTQKYNEVLTRRTEVPEDWFNATVKTLCEKQELHVNREQRDANRRRRDLEIAHMEDRSREQAELRAEELRTRISGNEGR